MGARRGAVAAALGADTRVGAYGKVKLCVDKRGNEYAMKILNKTVFNRRRLSSHASDVEDIKREIAIMKKLNHPNVVRLCALRERSAWTQCAPSTDTRCGY